MCNAVDSCIDVAWLDTREIFALMYRRITHLQVLECTPSIHCHRNRSGLEDFGEKSLKNKNKRKQKEWYFASFSSPFKHFLLSYQPELSNTSFHMLSVLNDGDRAQTQS